MGPGTPVRSDGRSALARSRICSAAATSPGARAGGAIVPRFSVSRLVLAADRRLYRPRRRGGDDDGGVVESEVGTSPPQYSSFGRPSGPVRWPASAARHRSTTPSRDYISLAQSRFVYCSLLAPPKKPMRIGLGHGVCPPVSGSWPLVG